MCLSSLRGSVIIGWSALCVLVAGHPGCVLSGTVTEERARLGAKLEAVDSRARICAPRELAEARANLEFATYEAGEGQSLRAAEHLAEALRLTGLAEEASKGDECEPDRDLDGIRDSKDKCPTEAEDYDGHADEDGCPDYDRDNDGVEDDVDRYPDIPEDRDGFQDSDGCPDKDNDRDGIVDANDQ